MASQDEMHEKSGVSQASESDKQTTVQPGEGTKLETPNQQPAPFSEFDPFRATRTAQVISETQAFLDPLGKTLTGTEGLNEDQLRSLSADAQERAQWSQAGQDAFTSLLRLGSTIPPRGKRVL